MTPEAISAIFTGLTALIAALAALLANRSKKIELDQRAMKKRLRYLERQMLALVAHTFTLEMEIVHRGGVVPPRPSVLDQFYEDEAEVKP